MQQPDKFKDYAALVCGQLRWKKARPVVEREIETHLRDQCDALVQSGMDAEKAVDESIRQMGDAVEIGTSLDRVHRPKPSWGLLILTVILLAAGLAIQRFVIHDAHILPRYTLSVVLGVCFFLGAYFMDFTLLGKWPLAFYIGALVLIGGVVLSDPRSYFAAQLTLLLPLVYAALLYGLRSKRYLGLILAFAGLAIQCVCCCTIPSMAGLLVTAVVGIALLAAAAWVDWFKIGRARSCVILAALILPCGTALFFHLANAGYFTNRILIMLHPETDPFGAGWEAVQIRNVLAGAQMVGTGTVPSETYDYYVPFLPRLDRLLTCLIYDYGWISLILVLAIYAVFFTVALHKCRKQKNILGRLVSLAVILTLAFQVLFYVCFNLGISLFGVFPLPLVSYGNTALVVDLALIGVMLSAFRTGALVRDGDQPLRGRAKPFRWADRVRWKDGVLTISFKKDLAS